MMIMMCAMALIVVAVNYRFNGYLLSAWPGPIAGRNSYCC